MTEPSGRQFGLVIAYVLPGFIALAGLAPVVPAIRQWLNPGIGNGLGIGPPVYALMAATSIGLIVSCIRWLVVDQVHVWTGVVRPDWDNKRLAEALDGFDYLVQNHFRYYEFCGNSFVALLLVYAANRVMGAVPFLNSGTDFGLVILLLVLFTASRDALVKYYSRTGQLLGSVADKDFGGVDMFNGNHQQNEAGKNPQPQARKKTGGSRKKPTKVTAAASNRQTQK